MILIMMNHTIYEHDSQNHGNHVLRYLVAWDMYRGEVAKPCSAPAKVGR